MEPINFSCYVLKRKTSVLLYVMITLSIVAAILWIVITNNSHQGITDPVVLCCVLGTFLFGGISVALYITQRIQISISNEGGALTVYVADKALIEPLYIQEPFTVTRQWRVDYTSKGGAIQTKRLYVTIADTLQQPVVTFTGVLSAAQTPPPEFELWDGDDELIIAADRCYETYKILPISTSLHSGQRR
jgi:hypothetical protein